MGWGGGKARQPARTDSRIPSAPAHQLPDLRGEGRGADRHVVKTAVSPRQTTPALRWVPGGGTAVQAPAMPPGSLQKLFRGSPWCWQGELCWLKRWAWSVFPESHHLSLSEVLLQYTSGGFAGFALLLLLLLLLRGFLQGKQVGSPWGEEAGTPSRPEHLPASEPVIRGENQSPRHSAPLTATKGTGTEAPARPQVCSPDTHTITTGSKEEQKGSFL